MTYRRFLRIGGELISSPRFEKKKDAEEWYYEMRRKKQFLRDGLIVPNSSDGVTFIEYARVWMKRRMANYPKSTWQGDEQRLRDYVLPLMSEVPMSSVASSHIRNLLTTISEEDFLRPGFAISPATRTRVRALLSAIFSDALNEDPPLVSFNPVRGLKIKEKRRGHKKPRHLADSGECLKFIEAARDLGWLHYVTACTFLMSGVRKQELIALRWSSVDFKNGVLKISEKFEQASGEIKQGTKGGEDVVRMVPISRELLGVLAEHKKKSEFNKAYDFVLSSKSGGHLGARTVWQIVSQCARMAQVDISPHGLRHSYGREFAFNTGNIKALQAILGHSSSQTTDIYSDLAGNRIKGFSESVSFGIGVKQSDK